MTEGMQLFLQIAAPAVAAGLVTWGVLKTELRYLRRDIGDAHDRLNQINAPAARVREHQA